MEVKLFDSIEEAHAVLELNRPRLVRAEGRNVCVVRMKGRISAFINECPHQGASLHQGSVNYLEEIVCPLHAYRFDTNSGEAIERNCRSLQLIPVRVTDGVYLVM